MSGEVDDTAGGRRVSRRSLLLGAAGGLVVAATGAGAAVEGGILPGRSTAHRLLGLQGKPGRIPDATPGRLVTGSFRSVARRGISCGYAISYPPGLSGRLPVLVVLHGRGGDHSQAFGDYLGLDRFLANAVSGGMRPFAVASVDGGDHGYWHRRASGEDAGAMVTEEFVPLLRRRGLSTSRIALFGWSMGGYGALWLATRLERSTVAAVVAESPAIWQRAADAASGAFDDRADFATHTMFGKQGKLAGIPLRVDCGTEDPFCPATRRFITGLDPAPAGGFQPGGHNVAYWRRMALAQLAFVARHW